MNRAGLTVQSTSQSMALGVVIERRELDNPWQRHAWGAVGVLPDAPAVEAPRVLRQGDGWVQYHAATLSVELHRRETEGYKRNLANAKPVVYVMLCFDEDDEDDEDAAPRPTLVTVCPYEAQDYLDAGGDEIVEPVPMPESVMAWVRGYVETYHVDEPFKKRKRKQWKSEEPAFGQRLTPARGRGHG